MIDTIQEELSEWGVGLLVTYCPIQYGKEQPWEIEVALPDDREACGHEHIVRRVETFERVVEELQRLLSIINTVQPQKVVADTHFSA